MTTEYQCQPPGNGSDDDDELGWIVGFVIGGVFLIIILVIVFIVFICIRQYGRLCELMAESLHYY